MVNNKHYAAMNEKLFFFSEDSHKMHHEEIFQQDGSTHTHLQSSHGLPKKTFSSQIMFIKFVFNYVWVLTIPQSTIFFRKFMKSKASKPNTSSNGEIKSKVEELCETVPKEVLGHVITAFLYRIKQ